MVDLGVGVGNIDDCKCLSGSNKITRKNCRNNCKYWNYKKEKRDGYNKLKKSCELGY